ncbi:DEAD/DEAH box helicase [Phytohabitans flavus]|uniref:DEAD/DEAH box helicase n=1 Tax=Phytohabitans flavus TaxID=1076124 RepID=UPI0031F101D3
MKLWSHQAEAVDDFCGQVSDGERGTVVAACGTGKTLMAAETSRRLSADEAVVVVVPTIDLLAQTIREWRAYLGPAIGPVVAVCNAVQIRQAARVAGIGLHEGVEVTTDPDRLAQMLGLGRVTVVATYASLPVITAALRRLPACRVGLLVVDEAHRTAGAPGKPWAMVHDDLAVPARRRMYLTATPRIVVDDDQPVISMDDVKVYGPVVHRISFATAIDLGLQADYRLVVAVVTHEELAGWKLDDDEVIAVHGRTRPARMLASQVALARAIRQYQLRRVLTYHNRVAAANWFATTLPDAVDLLGDDERPEQPLTAWSVSGASSFAHRARVIADLRGSDDRPVVVSNAKLFNEGVDLPAVDAVEFDDPRSAINDVIQAIGRSLRLGSQPGKVATIIVPVLTAEAHLAHGLDQRAWRTVWQVVNGLRAHDERVEDQLTTLRRTSDTMPDGLEPGSAAHDPPRAPSWLTTIGPHVPDWFADQIRLRMITATSLADLWRRQYAAAERFHTTHGHLDVPVDTDDPDLIALNEWLHDQRSAYNAGRMGADRIALLERIGMIWNRHEHRWQTMVDRYRHWLADGNGHDRLPEDLRLWRNVARRDQRLGKLTPQRKAQLDELGMPWQTSAAIRWVDGLAHLRAYRRQHGHLRVPIEHITEDGYPLGAFTTQLRQAKRRGVLPADREAVLDELGMVWNVNADAFQRQFPKNLAVLRKFHHEHGHIRLPSTHRLYKWLRSLPDKDLTAEQQAQLDALGTTWRGKPMQDEAPEAPGSRHSRGMSGLTGLV